HFLIPHNLNPQPCARINPGLARDQDLVFQKERELSNLKTSKSATRPLLPAPVSGSALPVPSPSPQSDLRHFRSRLTIEAFARSLPSSCGSLDRSWHATSARAARPANPRRPDSEPM